MESTQTLALLTGGTQHRSTDVLPPLTPRNRQMLTTKASSNTTPFQAIVASTRESISPEQAPANALRSFAVGGGPTRAGGFSPQKKRHTPLSRPINVSRDSDKEIIEEIRADLREKFSLAVFPGFQDGGGQSAAASENDEMLRNQPAQNMKILEVEAGLRNVILDPSRDQRQDLGSASAPDVGQIDGQALRLQQQQLQELQAKEGENESEDQSRIDRGRLHTTTPIASAHHGYPAAQMTAARHRTMEEQQRRESKRRFPGSTGRKKKRDSPTKRLASGPPPTAVPFSGPGDYTLPPVRHGFTPGSRQQTSRYPPVTSHRQRKPPGLYASTQVRQEIHQARVEYQEHMQHEYVSFVGRVSFEKKVFSNEKRDGLLWVPCERCHKKGTRCSTCKVIRVGGGYIILEADQLDARQCDFLKAHHGELTDENGELKIQSRPGTGFKAGWKIAGPATGDDDELNGRASSRRGGDDTIPEDDGNGDEGDDFNDGQGGASGRASSLRPASRLLSGRKSGLGGSVDDLSDGGQRSLSSNRQTRPPSAKRFGDGQGGRVPSARGSGRNSRLSGNGLGDSNGDLTESTTGQGNGGNSDQGGQGDENSGNGGSGRPPSAKGGGKQRTVRNRLKVDSDTGAGFHSARGGRKSPLGGEGGYLSTAGGGGRSNSQVQSRMKSAPPVPRSDDTGRRRKKKLGDGDAFEESDEEYDEDGEFDPTSRHKLRKFKSDRQKKDSMGVKECDWKDLKGIDPLDYLAKYCIVDQERIPTYERIYHNVDLDEDDEIDLEQLDFALKAVNSQLISDPEMDFVFHVLELAHRPKLDFKLFTLVAALSERVVMLEDMVKKMVNKMDFEALEVKMKKVKELFYLLADMEHRGGVVTTGSLAIELTAGGLTPEHVKLVVNHLNRDRKGLVQFLDYLTYVPLFLEIHGSIVSNPLDQNRDK